MKASQFRHAERYMHSCMQDTVHDTAHIYRVLYTALRIAKSEPAADQDVVMLAALLHDVGREAARTSGEKHAPLGAQMAHAYLLKAGWPEATAAHVRDCVHTHSYKGGLEPQALEAKILFDADKLDLTGAVGTARAIQFGEQIGEPLYTLGEDGQPLPGKPEERPSLLREYCRKLRHLPGRFYTKKAAAIARRRQQITDDYFEALRSEVQGVYKKGARRLAQALEED